jgi:type III restriction enzyme
VIARDTTHAGELMRKIQTELFEGRYRDKVIQVDSSKTGKDEDEMIERLLRVEHNDEPTEIVIHVNMLKEGWDVTNLYTIVPLRAANAKTLVEQSIGRGLRLPYGRRTGVKAVDRLNIVAHDKFQEIVDAANRPDSLIRMEQVILDPASDLKPMTSVVSQPVLLGRIGGDSLTIGGVSSGENGAQAFATEEERRIAQVTLEVVRRFESQPSSSDLLRPEIQAQIVREVAASYAPAQGALALAEQPDVAAVVARASELLVEQTIDVPRIVVVPRGEVSNGFNDFTLELASINYQPVERDILIQHLRTREQETLTLSGNVDVEVRSENYIVRALIDYDDISYDHHADLLYDLAGQMVAHLRGYLPDEDVINVLQYYQRPLGEFIHTQMQDHYWEKVAGYEAVVSKGFTALKPSAYTASAERPVVDFRHPVDDKGRIGQMLFGGFSRCLYPVQKFDSDTERRVAVILDRDAVKWFRPASGQFQIFYKVGHEQKEYQPDFVAETDDRIYMIEAKARKEMDDAVVQAKKESALAWCGHATDHAQEHGKKPWSYLLVPHDAVSENMTLKGLVGQFSC